MFVPLGCPPLSGARVPDGPFLVVRGSLQVSQRWRKANLIPVLVPFSSPTSPRSPITSVHNV